MPLESQLPQYERWARFLKNGQMGNVFFLPWVGMMYRIAQFVEYVGKVRLIDLQNVVEEGVDLIGELPKKGKLIIIMRRILLSPHGMRIAREMEKWLVEFEGGVLFVHEMASCELSINHDWPSWVVASRNNYQLPEQGGMEIYIKNINREMGVSLNKEESKEIARAYGGWWWLVDDIFATKLKYSEWEVEELFKHETVIQKMQLLWQSWPKEYQKVILGMKKDNLIEKEMREIGIVNKDGIIIGLELAKFVQKQKIEELEITIDQVIYRGKDVGEKFMSGERRVLTRLWASQEMVKREEISKLFWQNEEMYIATDWAIDQKMRRLKQKVQKFDLPIKIVTKRGLGYVII